MVTTPVWILAPEVLLLSIGRQPLGTATARDNACGRIGESRAGEEGCAAHATASDDGAARNPKHNESIQ